MFVCFFQTIFIKLFCKAFVKRNNSIFRFFLDFCDFILTPQTELVKSSLFASQICEEQLNNVISIKKVQCIFVSFSSGMPFSKAKTLQQAEGNPSFDKNSIYEVIMSLCSHCGPAVTRLCALFPLNSQ